MFPFYLKTILTLSGLAALGRAAPAGTGPAALGPNGGANVSNSDVVYCGPKKGDIVNTGKWAVPCLFPSPGPETPRSRD